MLGGVSEHSRVLAEAALGRGFEVHVWTAAAAGPMEGVQVHGTLGAFAAADLERTDSLLDEYPAPRRLVVQWVPHGFGRRGMNVTFARWVARRGAGGDRVDVIVHEPFVDFFGGSWLQPARAAVQRYMTRTVIGKARQVWMSIPGWESRLLSVMPAGVAPRVLPVPGTIPIDRDAAAVAALRSTLPGDHGAVVGYFGTGGEYVEQALAGLVPLVLKNNPGAIFLCLGRGSEHVAARLQKSPGGSRSILATGAVSLGTLSHALQICDALVQPYIDGVSGRRTTTVSALEHGVPVATTFGDLSEPFWKETGAVETVPAAQPLRLAGAVLDLLEPARNARARADARTLYAARFDPRVALGPLFD